MTSDSLMSTVAAASALPTAFVPAEVEGPLYQSWVDRGYFTADPASAKPAFSLVIPPPNVTGSLHMGHALEHTLMDILTRRKRMQGYEALWLPGMDHAGIATQNVVEKTLAAEGLSRHDLGRVAFLERVWQWKDESGGAILGQMRRLGDSVDWSRQRFTMDPGLTRAVGTMFKRLYDDGLIYRAERIINWCPRDLTALSDIEVEHLEEDGELVSIRYGDGEDSVVVATTRVETMLGDTAVAVHPDDERYRHMVGREIELPLVGRMIKVVADEHVDPAFGTGAVKVTPAHDPNDFEIGRRHGLEMINVMDPDAAISLPGPWLGMDRFEARSAITEELRRIGRIAAERRPYVHSVGHCSRCGTTVEPRLSLQWFVNVAPLAKAAGDAVRDGTVRIHPQAQEPRWFAWVDNMHDWCISRQLWWGHRIPVWYGPDGETLVVGPDDPMPTGEGWHQDEDVLDTWFSSGLWPFSTLGWPERTPDLEKFYPTTVLVTGYDILFFWVARMMMFGLYAMAGNPAGAEPFHTVALHGMVRDARGKKMSKSFGNAVDPLDWMDKYGADAVRFTLARGANPGTDVPTSEDWVQGSRNFTTKLWNATRFALMRGATTEGEIPDGLSAADRWILSRLAAVQTEADAFYDNYEFAKVCDLLFHFAWDEVFDWYVELVKAPLEAGGPGADATRRVLGEVFDTLLRLLHPVMPFLTEQLWTTLTGGESVVVAAWPAADQSRRDPQAEHEIALLQSVITEVRRFRAEQGIKPRTRLAAVLQFDDPQAAAAVPGYLPQLQSLAGLEPVTVGEQPAGCQSVVVPGVRVGIDTSGAIDVAAERARLAKLLATAAQEVTLAENKLADPAFTGKAPQHVIDKISGRLAAAQADLGRITAQLDALPAA
ncbi:MAG: valyl-tRNA synthetase [Frankiales bacterium]|jgi:valyl-tRNA synthetase|nr:valyl-tRNA synthetase [Frankiales bacterium]